MKFIASNANFMGFHFLKQCASSFHLDETPLLSFFINSLSCHQKILCDILFSKNEILIESSLSDGKEMTLLLIAAVVTGLANPAPIATYFLKSVLVFDSIPVFILYCYLAHSNRPFKSAPLYSITYFLFIFRN
jgi:hypothetical protein